MKKRSVTVIIILFSVALIGLLFSQWLWIKKSYSLKEEQLDHRIDMALGEVISEFDRFNDTSINAKLIIDTMHRGKPKTILDIVEPVLLDTLLAKYTQYHKIDIPYEYAIIRSCNDSAVFKTDGYVYLSGDNRFKACLSCLWEKEYYHLSVIFPGKKAFILTDFSIWVIISVLLILIVGGSFWYTVYTFIQQKKISEIKNDFVNNMTHEFKTPISTIQLTGEVLKKKVKSFNDPVIERYTDIILNENMRMRVQVERILQMAIMDKGEFHLNKSNFDLHDLIHNSVDNLCLDFCENNAEINYELNAKNKDIFADKVHITNIIVNLVQNSIKYSKGVPDIKISTFGENGIIKISVEDKGIGMSPEKMKYVFDKFYRIPTGNVHDVKGFGLGLFYVKTMTEAHGGEVKVKSHLNKGSCFDVILPVSQN